MICTCRIRVSLKHLGIDTAPARECHGAIDHFLSNVLLNMLLTAVRIGQPLGSGIPRRGEEVATFKCKSKKNKALCFSCEHRLYPFRKMYNGRARTRMQFNILVVTNSNAGATEDCSAEGKRVGQSLLRIGCGAPTSHAGCTSGNDKSQKWR